ncbi:3-oxoacyl-[acyl-carrier-protein] synthase III C-terminal domain-containing protein [Amycolatopsis sp. H20-H5]|uniref:3-oxoacyl-[acyl-carrier-protein] synthase III C-terminal domain-containing protein n=1 Tax=Amycolatopsis sp. H20-H5 TaxID=3046309 RepID=UPI002DBA5E07|nr:3-oxoacyl-[acyl-carrier-protein] synthase III C-terminal domain-containing protein [Amycolatopsis sp. H20-H5]MEC3976894.1 3-oxoacyl-[acyl-carrier-protein] synthase III C-terminal domain-containing protein [Amycolatopsis sp. H20-H5]
MTSLEAVAVYVPPERVPVEPYLRELGVADEKVKLYKQFFGFSEIRREPGGTALELMRAALGELDLAGREDRVRYLVQAATILSAPYPRSPLHELRAEFGLHRATAFSLSQHACASGLLAVDVCGRLLAADDDPDALALVLVGEKTFTEVARIADSAVMSEGMAAVLVGTGGPRDRLLSYATRSYAEFDRAPWLTPEQGTRFDKVYPVALVEILRAALDEAGLAPSDVALVLPHNVNRLSWYRVAKTLGLPKDRIVLGNLPEYGHSFGADSFLGYRSALDLGRLNPGDHYVMTAVGLGATFAAMVFRH